MRGVVLLRGVNVGASNRIKMPLLAEVLEGVGCREVSTYVQSGNAVVSWTGAAAALEVRVRAALVEQAGVDVPVMVRTAAQLATVVEGNPWAGEDLDPKKLHVAFLSGRPLPLGDLSGLAPERVAVGDRELYVDYALGAHKTRLGTVLSAKRLGVEATARNWRTVTALRDLTA